MTKRAIIICTGLLAAALAYGLWLLPRLPSKVPSHWNAAGEVDGWSSNVMAVWLVPVIGLVVVLLLAVLPAFSPKGKEVKPFQSAYDAAGIFVTVFLVVVHVATLQAAFGPVDMLKIIMTTMGLLFAGLGNLMGKVTRNYWMGIRTAWTLESDYVWERTHRLAGWTMTAGGIACSVIALATPWPWAGFILAMAGALAPVPYSWFVYKGTSTTSNGQKT